MTIWWTYNKPVTSIYVPDSDIIYLLLFHTIPLCHQVAIIKGHTISLSHFCNTVPGVYWYDYPVLGLVERPLSVSCHWVWACSWQMQLYGIWWRVLSEMALIMQESPVTWCVQCKLMLIVAPQGLNTCIAPLLLTYLHMVAGQACNAWVTLMHAAELKNSGLNCMNSNFGQSQNKKKRQKKKGPRSTHCPKCKNNLSFACSSYLDPN